MGKYSLDTTAITDKAAVKDFLQIDAQVANDNLLIAMINAASTAIESHLGHPVINTTITDEYHDGDGSTDLLLKYMPVASVTTITIDDVAVTGYTLEGEIGSIYLEEGFSAGRRNVKITYVAGHGANRGALPKDIVQAAIITAGEWYLKWVEYYGQALGDEAEIRMGNQAIPGPARALLDKYRQRRI